MNGLARDGISRLKTTPLIEQKSASCALVVGRGECLKWVDAKNVEKCRR